ncbi:hypothetical protein O9929_12370 [Vibrio lentus]|nr:hypothetical protein [Vibrio lentus]
MVQFRTFESLRRNTSSNLGPSASIHVPAMVADCQINDAQSLAEERHGGWTVP